MGKSRQSSTKHEGQLPQFKKDLPSDRLVDKMRDWQDMPGDSPDVVLTDEDIEFVKTHMQNSGDDENVPTGHLTRVEHAYHFLDLNLKEGDILNTNSIFRAFSRGPDGTNFYMMDNFGRKEPIVIYRTSGNVPHFNITKHTDQFQKESESWIETGKLRIDKITHYTSETDDMKKVMIDNLHLENYPRELEMYDEDYIRDNGGFDPTPQDVIFVDVSYVE